ncbi:hypothetical protein PRUPE_7G065600 [Prunus persica]|uniref:TIR domain-containing protein n=1 Tax=Prunus persica TaxID=3760 RepID=A0A251N7P0_PRUPE|nr:hypothetical protein PRUPE_7G065600 [Prunus persica]
MTTQTSSASPPPSTPPPKYEVFLSFRGLDTRKGFTDYLYNALMQKGIHTFRDDEQLDSGEPISTALLKAIEESQISVVILSKNYATSTWCLDELATMVELAANIKSRLILPVFYDVTPSEVREQTGEHFKEVFAQHDKDFKGEPGKVTRWKESLTAIANLSGFDLRGYRYAKEVITKIVERIFAGLNNTILTFSNDLKDFIGMDRVNEIKAKMSSRLGSEEVCVVGICGMTGIGKTTIAKALSQGIRNQFEAFSFISKVGEISRKESLFHIQEQLCDHLLNKKVTTRNADDVICKRLCGKRVLIILDNVDELEQIEAVAGKNDAELSNRFGKGSRIIITTTDDRLLVNYKPMICRIDKLTQQESLLLFCRKAFKKDHPMDGYEKLSYKFVDYIDGLPLALEVLGSSLRDRSVEYWSSKLVSLKDNKYSIEKKIIDVLKASFDGLENQEQQQIFLDTACFFKGENVCRVEKIFESCGYYPGININILREKYLISIKGGKLWMHDLLQQMGREIVRGESKKEGERSRLWLHTDALPVLKKNKCGKRLLQHQPIQTCSLSFMAFKDTPDNPIAIAKSSASETHKNLDMGQPIVTVHNDTSAAPFTIQLNGKNYNTWLKMMLLNVSGHGKRELFLDLPIAKDVWVRTTQMYYDVSDELQIYELRCKETRITQGGHFIASYSAEHKSVWLELDRRRPINMKCPDDVKIRQAEMHKDYIFDFLACLDDKFDKIR